MNDEESRFIDGIYNYCDRWCERCPFTNRCRVFASEQRQMERHLLRGEDPDDPGVFMQDVAEALGESLQMLAEMAAEQGIDLDAEPPPPPRRRRRKDRSAPLQERTERWSDRTAALLERVRADLPAIGADLAGMAIAFSEAEQDETTQALERLRDACELLGRYHMLIQVKLARAAGSLSEAEKEESEELAGIIRHDALGTAKLIDECLAKAAAALWCVGEFSRDWQDDALPLAAEAEALGQMARTESPGHREGIRPGRDEPGLDSGA